VCVLALNAEGIWLHEGRLREGPGNVKITAVLGGKKRGGGRGARERKSWKDPEKGDSGDERNYPLEGGGGGGCGSQERLQGKEILNLTPKYRIGGSLGGWSS